MSDATFSSFIPTIELTSVATNIASFIFGPKDFSLVLVPPTGFEPWVTSIVSVDHASKVEARLGRQAVDGHSTKPDSKELFWKQIEFLGTIEDKQLPFFIEWK